MRSFGKLNYLPLQVLLAACLFTVGLDAQAQSRDNRGQLWGACHVNVPVNPGQTGPGHAVVAYWTQWEPMPPSQHIDGPGMQRVWSYVEGLSGVPYYHSSSPICIFNSMSDLPQSLDEAIAFTVARFPNVVFQRHVKTDFRFFNLPAAPPRFDGQ